MSQKITILLFLTVVLLGLFLRIYHLHDTPHGYHQDEVANAYVGRYILLNGRDPYGNRFPLLYFDKHGDFPPVIPMHITGAGTFFFGNTPFATRFPVALIGALAFIPMFFISRAIFRKNSIALFSILLLAVAPWHLAFSRVAAESIIALTIYLFGVWIALYSVRTSRYIVMTAAFLVLLSTYHLYPAFRLIVPLTFVAFVISLFTKNKRNRMFYLCAMFTIASFALTAYIASTPWGKGRYAQTSILSNLEKNNTIRQFIANEPNHLTARIFNNKPVFFAREFITQSLEYMSPSFLFAKGGPPPWFGAPHAGLLPLTALVFIAAAGRRTAPNKKGKQRPAEPSLILFTLLLVPTAIIPAALTVEHSPHTHRSMLLMIPLILLASYGLSKLMSSGTRGKQAASVLLVLLAAETVFFLHNYFQHVSIHTAVSRSDANRTVAEYLFKNKNRYDRIYMFASGWMPAYYLFFSNNYDRRLAGTFQKNFRLPKVDNIRFIDADCTTPDTDQLVRTETKNLSRVLVVMTSTCKDLPTTYKESGNIYDIAKNSVYRTYSITNTSKAN